MALFSQRKGLKPLKKAIQRESLDQETRNKLWSGIKLAILDNYRTPEPYIGYIADETKVIYRLIKSLWLNYFSKPIDTIPDYSEVYKIIREYFFKCEWNEALDFLEFIVKNIPQRWQESLVEISNNFLTAESSAYRFVGVEIIEISDENEMRSAEEALDSKLPYAIHLSRALELLSDRKSPDYRNSIKESISAVESICRTITSNEKACLPDCLKEIKKRHKLHPAFEQALLKLYGFSSDEGGIRHSLTEQSVEVSYSDAKYMFILCASFINYINGKLSE